MRIVEQTSTVLKLEDKNNFLSRFFISLFGIPFVLGGLAVLIFFDKLTTLKCHRLEPTQVACEVIASGLFGKKITSIPAGQLQSATVEVNRTSDGGSYRIALITKNKTIPFTFLYHSGTGKYQKAKQINAFLNNPQQMSLKIQEDDRWLAYPLGGVFALVGGGIIFGSLMWKIPTSCIFDKSSNLVYWNKKNLFQSETREQRLDEIREVKVIETNYSINDDKIYKLVLSLRSSQQISLSITGSQSDLAQLAESINLFLSR